MLNRLANSFCRGNQNNGVNNLVLNPGLKALLSLRRGL